MTENKDSVNKKIINFMANIYGKTFEEIESDWADEMTVEGPAVVIKIQFFNEDILELVENGVDIIITK